MESMKKKAMPVAHKAKLDNLHALRRMAMDMINSHGSENQNSPALHKDMSQDGSEAPDHLEQVMVAAKDKEGLQKGLERAKGIVGQYDNAEDDMQEPEQSMLDDSPEGMRSLASMDSDESDDDKLEGEDHLAHHSEEEGDEEADDASAKKDDGHMLGEMRDRHSVSAMFDKMRKSAKKKK